MLMTLSEFFLVTYYILCLPDREYAGIWQTTCVAE